MSTGTERAETGAVAWPGPDLGRRRPWGRWLVLGGALVIVAAAAVVITVAVPLRAGKGHGAGAASPAVGTSLATVTRRTLVAQTSVNATLGYAGKYQVAGHASGTITWLPPTGRVIRRSRVLYRVGNGTPVYLLYGQVPDWRALSEGMTGQDVRQLNANLVALGYATSAEISPHSDYFSAETAYALMRLQAHLGLTETRTLPLGQAVFLPSAIRVTGRMASLGGPASGMILQASSVWRVVTIALDATQQTQVKVGDKVTITLPTGAAIPGVVSSVGKVATAGSGGSGATIPVSVTPTHPKATGTLDQAPVQVAITTATARDALVVPVNALLARAGGGYAVEVAGQGGRHRLIGVTLGLFDDAAGLVQVTGAGLAPGQRVVVPAS